MRVLKIAFGHPDNVLSLSRELAGKVDLTLVFVVSGEVYQEGVLELDLQELEYGLNGNSDQNIKKLPRDIQNYMANSCKLFIIRTYDRKLFKDKGLRNFRIIRNAVRQLRKLNFDVVHFNGSSGFLLYFVPFFYRYPKAWTLHDYKAHSGEGNLRAWVINRLVARFNLKIVQHYNYLRKRLIADYHLNQHKVRTVYSGSLDVIKAFYPKEILNIPDSFILFFGRVSPYKGIDILIDAYSLLGDKARESCSLIVAGKGSLNFDMDQSAQSKDLVVINRYITSGELAFLINKCQFVVVPYKDATHSAVIATAYAFNKPVIVSDVDGLDEVVFHQKTGLLVPPSNPYELSKAISMLMNDQKLLNTFSVNIAKLRESGFLAWDTITDHYVKLYKEINK